MDGVREESENEGIERVDVDALELADDDAAAAEALRLRSLLPGWNWAACPSIMSHKWRKAPPQLRWAAFHGEVPSFKGASSTQQATLEVRRPFSAAEAGIAAVLAEAAAAPVPVDCEALVEIILVDEGDRLVVEEALLLSASENWRFRGGLRDPMAESSSIDASGGRAAWVYAVAFWTAGATGPGGVSSLLVRLARSARRRASSVEVAL